MLHAIRLAPPSLTSPLYTRLQRYDTAIQTLQQQQSSTHLIYEKERSIHEMMLNKQAMYQRCVHWLSCTALYCRVCFLCALFVRWLCVVSLCFVLCLLYFALCFVCFVRFLC